MARERIRVQHFIASTMAAPLPGGPEYAYVLNGVRYLFDIPGHREWPIRFDSLWLFLRIIGGAGTRYFDIDVVGLDGPGEREICSFTGLQVQFGTDPVNSRIFSVANCSYPRPGRYVFLLRLTGYPKILAREYIRIRRRP